MRGILLPLSLTGDKYLSISFSWITGVKYCRSNSGMHSSQLEQACTRIGIHWPGHRLSPVFSVNVGPILLHKSGIVVRYNIRRSLLVSIMWRAVLLYDQSFVCYVAAATTNLTRWRSAVYLGSLPDQYTSRQWLLKFDLDRGYPKAWPG